MTPNGANPPTYTTTPMPGTFIEPAGIVADKDGTIYVVQGALFHGSSFVTRHRPADGYAATVVAGNGTGTFVVEPGQPAGFSAFNTAYGITIDAVGNLYVTDQRNYRICKLTPNGGSYTVTTIAGTGEMGTDNENSNALEATYRELFDITVDAAGNIYATDGIARNNVKLLWDGSSYRSTVIRHWGDGSAPYGIACDQEGNVFAADGGLKQVIKIN